MDVEWGDMDGDTDAEYFGSEDDVFDGDVNLGLSDGDGSASLSEGDVVTSSGDEDPSLMDGMLVSSFLKAACSQCVCVFRSDCLFCFWGTSPRTERRLTRRRKKAVIPPNMIATLNCSILIDHNTQYFCITPSSISYLYALVVTKCELTMVSLCLPVAKLGL